VHTIYAHSSELINTLLLQLYTKPSQTLKPTKLGSWMTCFCKYTRKTGGGGGGTFIIMQVVK